MSIKNRVEKLEEKYGTEKGCTILQVVYADRSKNKKEADVESSEPPEGAAKRYIKENNLCENCTKKGLCVLYWNGETFSQDPVYRGKPQ